MRLKTLTFFLFLGLCSCKSSSYLLSSSYNLKKSVSYISEKSIPKVCDSSFNTEPDTSQLDDVSFINYFFAEDGRILKCEYFQEDSILTRYDDYIYSGSGIFRMNSYKNGEADYFVTTRSHTNNSIVTETFDFKTHNLISVFRIRFVNGLVSKMKIRDFKNKNHMVIKYKYDALGNEIQRIRRTNLYDEPFILNIHYLEYDNAGNWIKRIEYSDEYLEDCTLELRRIEYYINNTER